MTWSVGIGSTRLPCPSLHCLSSSVQSCPSSVQPCTYRTAPREVRRSPDGVAPAILVSAQLALHGPGEVRATLLPALLGALVPWAMTHHHATRTFALLVLQAREAAMCSQPCH